MDQPIPSPYEVIAMTADVACGVLGRGTDFMLLPLSAGAEALPESSAALARQKGFSFCGILGLRNGEPLAQCEPDPASIAVMALAAGDFIRQYAHLIVSEVAAAGGDSVAWLNSLAVLEDPRTILN